MRIVRRVSEVERNELWARWKAGESIAETSAALGRHLSSLHDVIVARGGVAPVPRKRAERALSLAEREEISRGLSAGESGRQIALRLGRAPSTVSREIARNQGRVRYRATRADRHAWLRAKRPKICRLATHPPLRRVVAQKLRLRWSPQQISGWLRQSFANDPSMQLSHETIYRSLFIQARGVLKKELLEHLRTHRQRRRAALGAKRPRSGPIADAVSIRERPASVEDRAVPGHWEGDLLMGSEQSHIATLVERHSRFVMLVKLKQRDSVTVASALAKHMRTLPKELRGSLTWDRGSEMAQHVSFRIATGIDVYFCDPQSPWQRGSNENTNGLLRQYFPDGTELSQYSQRQLNAVARQLNQRPRKTLGFRTPADTLQEALQ